MNKKDTSKDADAIIAFPTPDASLPAAMNIAAPQDVNLPLATSAAASSLSRRSFLQNAITAGTGLLIASLLPAGHSPAAAQAVSGGFPGTPRSWHIAMPPYPAVVSTLAPAMCSLPFLLQAGAA